MLLLAQSHKMLKSKGKKKSNSASVNSDTVVFLKECVKDLW